MPEKLSKEQLKLMDAYWRAAKLSIGGPNLSLR